MLQPCPSIPPSTNYVWVGTYFGKPPVWAQDSLPRAEPGGSRVLPAPSSLISRLIAMQRKPGTGSVWRPSWGLGERGYRGLGQGEGQEPLAGAGRKGSLAAALPPIPSSGGGMGKWGGWITAIPIHSLPAQRGAPSPAFPPKKAAPNHPILKPLPAQGSHTACLGP